MLALRGRVPLIYLHALPLKLSLMRVKVPSLSARDVGHDYAVCASEAVKVTLVCPGVSVTVSDAVCVEPSGATIDTPAVRLVPVSLAGTEKTALVVSAEGVMVTVVSLQLQVHCGTKVEPAGAT